ncbi:MAG: hypothetical protein JNN10_03460 [Sphingopyxis sp.]|uniref:hypothetical protein n=1 Tax=Sphingopyxis sp. TaxID=1908224 RepID=UPI001A4755C4|nr:hypothetical protein [Sphingopyxis sp.]MBL9065332.1 hypothetical protein [Sphingopyxis sp.]
MGLLLERFRTREAPDRSARLANPASVKATLAAIGQKIESGGGETLSTVESKIWNTAAVIYYMAPASGDRAPENAKVLSWAAARAGFEDMGLPDAATFVTSLVTELAFRTEMDPRDRRGETESLIRLARLKQEFSAIEEQHDLWELLRKLIERTAC